MQVHWTAGSMWAAASLSPGISLLALAQVCQLPGVHACCMESMHDLRSSNTALCPAKVTARLLPCAQVPLTMGNSFLMLRSSFCIAASLTTNELIGRARYGYMKARCLSTACACQDV